MALAKQEVGGYMVGVWQCHPLKGIMTTAAAADRCVVVVSGDGEQVTFPAERVWIGVAARTRVLFQYCSFDGSH